MSDLLEKCKSYMASGQLTRKIAEKVLHTDAVKYHGWLRRQTPGKAMLASERDNSKNGPLISIVVPAYRTYILYFAKLIMSVKKNSYQNWELIIADGSGYDKGDRHYYDLKRVLTTDLCGDVRIRYLRLRENLGIAGNTNAAIKASKGKWIIFCDHDDELSRDALYRVWEAVQKNKDADIIYSDEDKIDEAGVHFDPHFKPDYDPELLMNVNYISHLCAVKRELLLSVGLLNDEFNGAQDYDFILRACEQAKNIVHIDRVLYSWRCHRGSTAKSMGEKNYAVAAGMKALQSHLVRNDVAASVTTGKLPGSYRVEYEDGGEELYVIKTHRNILPKVDFEKAKGRLVLFVDEDIAPSDDTLKALRTNLKRSEIGAVGPVITAGPVVEQGGYVLGLGDTFGGVPTGQPGYMGRLFMSRSVSALSAQCMMVKGDILAQTGIDSGAGSNWDRKLCLDIWKRGYRVIILPETVDTGKPCRDRGADESSLKELYGTDRFYNRAFKLKRPGYEVE